MPDKNKILTKSLLLLALMGLIIGGVWFMKKGQVTGNLIPKLMNREKSSENLPDYSNSKFDIDLSNHPTFGYILTDSKGRTLYSRTGGASVLNPSFAPAISTQSTPTAPGNLGSKVSIDGTSKQLTFDGKLLFLFADDKNPGDVFGDGVDSVWSVVKVEAPY